MDLTNQLPLGERILFEQPTNEAIRICLRLEKLATQFQAVMQTHSDIHCRIAVDTLLETLKLVSRPDLKSKLAQCLAQINASLEQMRHFPTVSPEQLQGVKKRIEDAGNQLHGTHGKFGEILRYNEFIKGILLQVNTPAGICEYASPQYLLWFTLPIEQRFLQLKEWYRNFDLLNHVANLILDLVRTSSDSTSILAGRGFYQQSLPMQPPCYMIRVSVEKQWGLYPEISVGRHRLSVYFLKLDFNNLEKRPVQTHDDIQFELNICQI